MYLIAAAVAGIFLAIPALLVTKVILKGISFPPGSELASGLSLATIKGFACIVVLLPAAFIGFDDLPKLMYGWSPLFLMGACLCTVIGDAAYIEASRHGKLGVLNTIFQSVIALTALVVSVLILGEVINFRQGIGVLVLLVCMGLLGRTRNEDQASDGVRERPPLWGVILMVVAGVLCGGGNVLFGLGARGVHPGIAAYVWQVGAGLFGFVILLALKCAGRIPVGFREALTPKIVLKVSATAIFLLFGVYLFGWAQANGNLGLANVVATTVVKLTIAFAAWFFFKERISNAQWLIIVISCCGLILLK